MSQPPAHLWVGLAGAGAAWREAPGAIDQTRLRCLQSTQRRYPSVVWEAVVEASTLHQEPGPLLSVQTASQLCLGLLAPAGSASDLAAV